jgi:hypothetical protein
MSDLEDNVLSCNHGAGLAGIEGRAERAGASLERESRVSRTSTKTGP